jgi:Phage integrase, N-terminal SAM-like domain
VCRRDGGGPRWRPGLTVSNIARRRNGRLRGRYRDRAGKEHARHFDRKVEAQLWLDSVTTSVHTGSHVDPKRMRLTLGDWSAQWLATKVNLKPTTRRGYEWALRAHILPTWGPVRLGDISHQGIAAWVAGMTRSGLAASSFRQTHRVLSPNACGLPPRHTRTPPGSPRKPGRVPTALRWTRL